LSTWRIVRLSSISSTLNDTRRLLAPLYRI
jgi:hypothetical protein